MKLEIICKTCEFFSGEGCVYDRKNCKKIVEDNFVCEEWGASLAYYTEITKNAPWYIRELYEKCQISYKKFLDLIREDDEGVGIEVNIYDAIEKIYELESWELAGVLDVSTGVLYYARTQKTIARRKKQFSSRLHIPENFFDTFLSSQLGALQQCKEEFYNFYGSETIEKLKQNGIKAINAKLEKEAAKNKILNEKYREENKNKYHFDVKNNMYHDLSDDYKSRDYIVAITLKEGEYYGNIFYEYTYSGYGLTVSIMEDILNFIENLDCEEIDAFNEEGLLNTNIDLKSNINSKEIYFELKNNKREILRKTIPDEELQKYIVGYEMIRCDGHGKKKERRRCESCKNFQLIEGCARGNCSVRGDVVQRSRIICAFDYIPK